MTPHRSGTCPTTRTSGTWPKGGSSALAVKHTQPGHHLRTSRHRASPPRPHSKRTQSVRAESPAHRGVTCLWGLPGNALHHTAPTDVTPLTPRGRSLAEASLCVEETLLTHPNVPRGVHTGPGLTARGSICMHSPPRTRRTLRTYLMHQARGSRVSAFLLSSPSLNTDFLRARVGGKRFSVRGERALSGLGPHAQEHADSTCSPRRGRGKVLFSVCTEQLVVSAHGPQPSWTDRPAEEQVASADARECLPAERGQRCRQGFAGHTQEPPHDYMRTGLFSLGRDSLPPADKLCGGTTCLSHDPRRDPSRAGLRALLALRALAAQRTEH